jgi:subtilisin-like proprotein convertase family protein/subtilisin family serine protease
MNRTLKVFCTGSEQDRLADSYPIVERYQGFLLIEAPEEEVDALTKAFPVEDITDLYAIRVGEHAIDTSQPRLDARGKLHSHPYYRGMAKLSPTAHHHLVQFIGPIKEEWLERVAEIGGELRAPAANFTYVVRSDEKTLRDIAALPFVRWVGHLPHPDRIAPAALQNAGRKPHDAGAELPRTRILAGVYTVEFFGGDELQAALPGVESLGFEVLDQTPNGAVLVLKDPRGGPGAQKRLRALSAIHGVRLIRERALPRSSNDVAAGIMGAGATLDDSSLGLSGQGEIVAVCDTGLDTGDAASIHQDFRGRVKALLSYPITPDLAGFVNNPGGDDGPADFDSGHGTHVAGSVLGDGRSSRDLDGHPIRGLAHRARLVFQAIEQEMKWKDPQNFNVYGRYLLTGIPLDLTTLFADAYSRGARVHSNSWGGGDPGAYDIQCQQLDRFVWDHKDLCILFANGNDGTDQDGDGRINPKSVTSPATAKNCISVGACENRRPNFNGNTYGSWWPGDYPVAPFRNAPMADDPEQVVAFSSRGPTDDGRIKPDVVAPGTFILSTRSTMIAPNHHAWGAFPPSRAYFHMGGTSMATPLTAGAVAVIREYLRNEKRIRHPSAALLKAALIAGATRLPDTAPPGVVADNDQGYGRVNLDAVLTPAGPARSEFVEVTPGLRTGEVHTLDIAVGSGETPLRIVLAYSDFPGPTLVNNLNLILTAPSGARFIGNHGGGSLSLDARNNVEVIHVPQPEPGTWRLQVVASNVPRGPQDFALAYLAAGGQPAAAEMIHLEDSPALDIPDNDPTGVSGVLNVARPGRVANVTVGVDIAHSYIGDLRVVLTAPDRTAVVLHDRGGARTRDLIKTFDARTTRAMTDLAGIPVQGDWRLEVSDHAPIDLGQLRHWTLTIALASADTIERESTPGAAIPDDDRAGVTDRLDITQSATLRDIQVEVDITHTWIGDLRVELTSPTGHLAVLHDRTGRGQDNLIKTYTTENVVALAGLAGIQTQGQWTLKVMDLAGRDIGKLNRWGLRISI